MKTAILLGATGMIGNEILENLSNDDLYTSIYVYSRSPINHKSAKIKNILTDFSDIEQLTFPDKVDSLFSCLGTTRKKTPDLTKYAFIEIEIPIQMVKRSLQIGLKQVHYISSIGANPMAKNYYLKLKGTAEKELSNLDISSLYIYQPGFLIGERKNYSTGERLIQKLVQPFDLFCVGKAKKYHSIKKEQLASAIVSIDKENNKGSYVLDYSTLEGYFKKQLKKTQLSDF